MTGHLAISQTEERGCHDGLHCPPPGNFDHQEEVRHLLIFCRNDLCDAAAVLTQEAVAVGPIKVSAYGSSHGSDLGGVEDHDIF